MIKAIFKKQILESFSWLYYNKKNGKLRKKGGIIGFAVLYLIIFIMLGYVFYSAAKALCGPLCGLNFGWLYFVLMGFMAVSLGVFGSVFNTYSSLYLAKDNDLLLSMPIPTDKILLSRLTGVYLTGLMYELIVMIPAVIVWFIYGNANALGKINSIIVSLVLSVFILFLSCALGWVVAFISSKTKNKSLITMVLSLAFLAIYYSVYMRAYKILNSILLNAENIAHKVKNILYPFYHMGRAAEGNALSLLIFTVTVLIVFAVIYFLLSRSFLKLATSNKGTIKVKYKQKTVKQGSLNSALFRKELKRFTSSANYMLNCGIGIIFMLIGAGAMLIRGKVLAEAMKQIFYGNSGFVYLIIAAAICLVASMCDISAPSVSLEGKNIWIVQVLPVSPWQVILAKLRLHLAFTLPPVIVLTASTLLIFKPPVAYCLVVAFCVVAFSVMMAALGLFLNLLSPNLLWTDEVVPIKQSLSVMVSLFGGWAVVLALGILYLVLADTITPLLFLTAAGILFSVVAIVLYFWLKNKGARIFAYL